MLGKLVAVSFAVVVTALLVTSSIDTGIAKENILVMAYAQTTLGENSSVNEPYTVGDTLSEEEMSQRIDDIRSAILQLQIQNQHLSELATNKTIQDMIKDNDKTLDILFAQLDQISHSRSDLDVDIKRSNQEWSMRFHDIGSTIMDLRLENQHLSELATNKTIQDMIKDNNDAILELKRHLDKIILELPVVDHPKSNNPKITAIMFKLAVVSDLPLIGMGIDGSTGMLDIIVDINRSTPDTEQKIREIAVGVKVNITYDKNPAVFQSSSCDRTTVYCDQLVDNSEDKC